MELLIASRNDISLLNKGSKTKIRILENNVCILILFLLWPWFLIPYICFKNKV